MKRKLCWRASSTVSRTWSREVVETPERLKQNFRRAEKVIFAASLYLSECSDSEILPQYILSDLHRLLIHGRRC